MTVILNLHPTENPPSVDPMHPSGLEDVRTFDIAGRRMTRTPRPSRTLGVERASDDSSRLVWQDSETTPEVELWSQDM